jgi:hypothetical protein
VCRRASARPVLAWEVSYPNAWFVTIEEILSKLLTWFAGTGPGSHTAL